MSLIEQVGAGRISLAVKLNHLLVNRMSVIAIVIPLLQD
jgi:hypothetical protein